MRRGVSIPAGVLAVAVLVAGALRAHAAAPYSLLGQSAPDFALRAVAGPNMRLSEHRGEVVVLTFWSSRCAPCTTQLAALQRQFATFRTAGFQVFGVSVDEDASRATRFAAAQAVEYPLLLDPHREVSRLYRVDALPMTILVDRGGAIRYAQRDLDRQAEQRWLAELRTLLNE